MLPPPALSPNANPFFRSGKKVLMLVIEEAKFPPPRPPTAATATNTQYGVPGCMTTAAKTTGISSNDALTIVQLRPPNRATAKVYGSRSTAPTSVGTATRKNLPAASMPYSGPMNSTSTDHMVQMENPMCSDRIENHRLRLAILAPMRSQKPSSSGFQSSIQRLAKRVRSPVLPAAVVVTRSSTAMRPVGSRPDARKRPFPRDRPDVTSARTATLLVTGTSTDGRRAVRRCQETCDRYFPSFRRAERGMCRGLGNSITACRENLQQGAVPVPAVRTRDTG